MPSGPPTQVGSAQSIPPSLLRSNSGMLGAQGGPLPSHLSPHTQFSGMNSLGNAPNVSSLLNQSFGNRVLLNTGNSGPVTTQHAGIDTGADSDTLSAVGNGMGFNTPSSFVPPNMANHVSSGQLQNQQFANPTGTQVLAEQQHTQQLEPQNFQNGQQQMQQFSASHNTHQLLSQQQFQTIRSGLSGAGAVKLETQAPNDQQHQQLQTMRKFAPIKLEPQQLQPMRNMAPVKMEPQQSDPSLFLQQQQQFILSRQCSQPSTAQINLLQHQRLLQLQQQHQQQQLLKALPQQRPPLQQQFQQQNLPIRPPVKPVYEPGTCARRLTHYMYQQQQRPKDNNIEFWRKFVAEYFAPNAKKRWCVSMYGSGRQTIVFPQDVWHCEICNRKPGRGFEATTEVLPRLFKIKYESGTLEELLYVDMPREYQNPSGQIVLDYAKAVQESVFEQLRVVRDGQLRIVFSPDLKICSWEFCARRHEELIPRRLLIPQVSQLGAVAQKYQAASQNASNVSASELQNNCNMLVASARQLGKALEVPLVNDLGYAKRYVRCLQISEVVNCMKDLIDYSQATGTGPMESLAKFSRRTAALSGSHGQNQQSEEHPQPQPQLNQQQTAQDSNNDPNSGMQNGSSNGAAGVNGSLNTSSMSTSASTIVGLLNQNSMNSRQPSPVNHGSSPYGGSGLQVPSPCSSGTIQQTQCNSSFQPPTPTSSNIPSKPSYSGIATGNNTSSSSSPANMSMQQPALSGEADASESQSSVQKIIHDMMLSNQLNGRVGIDGAGSLGNDVKNINGILPTGSNLGFNASNYMVGSGTVNGNSATGVSGFGSMGSELVQSAMINRMRSAMGNNSIMNGRLGMTSIMREQSHQDLGNQLLNGLGAVNGFNNIQFD